MQFSYTHNAYFGTDILIVIDNNKVLLEGGYGFRDQKIELEISPDKINAFLDSLPKLKDLPANTVDYSIAMDGLSITIKCNTPAIKKKLKRYHEYEPEIKKLQKDLAKLHPKIKKWMWDGPDEEMPRYFQ